MDALGGQDRELLTQVDVKVVGQTAHGPVAYA